MSVSYNPSIVTSGMLMCIDAANTKSYPGSGTTVTDISGNGYTGTLVNAPSFSSTNQGEITYNGSTQYISIAQNTPTLSQITLEVVCKLSNPTPQSSGFIIGRSSSYRIIYNANGFDWVCSTNNNAWYSTGTVLGTINATIANWNHLVCTYDGSNLRMYINGALVGTSASAISGNIQNGSNLQMMQSDAGNISYGNGTIAAARIYNVALSATAVRQNFNAIRGRYGI